MKQLLFILSLFTLITLWWCINQNNKQNHQTNTIWNKIDNTTKTWYKFIWFVGTFCSHCQAAVPELEKFYEQYSWQVNMELNILDKKQFESAKYISQNYTNPKQYEDYTHEKCWYVPSYIIVDKDNNVVVKQCWWTPTEEELKKYLLNSNNIISQTQNIQSINTWENVLINTWNTNEQDNLNNNKQTMTKKIRLGDTIEVDYIWTFQDGKVFDTSLEKEAKNEGIYNSTREYKPLKFTAGSWQMIPCFDKGVIDMEIWQTKDITCNPEEAYGQCEENKIQTVKKEQLKQFEDAGYKIEKWTELPTQYGMIKIKDVKGDDVIFDLNHPMCWKTLNFKVTIVKINE